MFVDDSIMGVKRTDKPRQATRLPVSHQVSMANAITAEYEVSSNVVAANFYEQEHFEGSSTFLNIESETQQEDPSKVIHTDEDELSKESKEDLKSRNDGDSLSLNLKSDERKTPLSKNGAKRLADFSASVGQIRIDTEEEEVIVTVQQQKQASVDF